MTLYPNYLFFAPFATLAFSACAIATGLGLLAASSQVGFADLSSLADHLASVGAAPACPA